MIRENRLDKGRQGKAREGKGTNKRKKKKRRSVVVEGGRTRKGTWGKEAR